MNSKKATTTIKTGGVLAIAFLLFGLYEVLREKTYLSANEVIQRIEKEIPKGVSLDHIARFAHSYDAKFETNVSRYESVAAIARNSEASEIPINAKNYFKISIYQTGSIPLELITNSIYITFYFDEKSNLIDYKIRTLGDGL